jgi:hypothetical protein
MVSNTKPNVVDKDNVIKKLEEELVKMKKLLACSDKNRNILYQRLDEFDQRHHNSQSCYEALQKRYENLQLAHRTLASKSLVLAKQWQGLRQQQTQKVET